MYFKLFCRYATLTSNKLVAMTVFEVIWKIWCTADGFQLKFHRLTQQEVGQVNSRYCYACHVTDWRHNNSPNKWGTSCIACDCCITTRCWHQTSGQCRWTSQVRVYLSACIMWEAELQMQQLGDGWRGRKLTLTRVDCWHTRTTDEERVGRRGPLPGSDCCCCCHLSSDCTTYRFSLTADNSLSH